jgi:hypothetical protein
MISKCLVWATEYDRNDKTNISMQNSMEEELIHPRWRDRKWTIKSTSKEILKWDRYISAI